MYLDNNVVGWKPIADAWIESRTPQEIHVSYIIIQYICLVDLLKLQFFSDQ